MALCATTGCRKSKGTLKREGLSSGAMTKTSGPTCCGICKVKLTCTGEKSRSNCPFHPADIQEQLFIKLLWGPGIPGCQEAHRPTEEYSCQRCCLPSTITMLAPPCTWRLLTKLTSPGGFKSLPCWEMPPNSLAPSWLNKN